MTKQMERRLIINPTKKQEGTYEPLEQAPLKKTVFEKALRQKSESFISTIIVDKNLSMLLANVENKTVSVSDWIGKEVNTFDEASEFLNSFCETVYGSRGKPNKSWALKLIKSEVMYGKAKVYGLDCSDKNLVQQIQEMLQNVAAVEVNDHFAAKVKQTKTLKTDPKTEPKEESKNE